MSTKEKAFFKNKASKMPGEIYLSADIDKKYQSIVVTHPGNYLKRVQVAEKYTEFFNQNLNENEKDIYMGGYSTIDNSLQ